MTAGYFEYTPLTQRELADLQRRHIARGGHPVVRADSTGTYPQDQEMDASGMLVHREFDHANRPHITFSLPEGVTKRESWLKPYMAPTMLQTALTNSVAETRRQHQRFLAEHPEL